LPHEVFTAKCRGVCHWCRAGCSQWCLNCIITSHGRIGHNLFWVKWCWSITRRYYAILYV
jgi:hypothetical protein